MVVNKVPAKARRCGDFGNVTVYRTALLVDRRIEQVVSDQFRVSFVISQHVHHTIFEFRTTCRLVVLYVES
jgi:hypothetical protein